ncbi:hypothetical protein [Nakamurella deserti]|uniref:hypothetical protein n=1 Tax=Nakamurella deserti TaxID=2164074 RepID=UPI0013009A0D|nr:hypothetical protein [Nakamurella deserti]
MEHRIRRIAGVVVIGMATVGLAVLGTGTASATDLPHSPATTLQIDAGTGGVTADRVAVRAGQLVTVTTDADGTLALSVAACAPGPTGTARVADRTDRPMRVTVTTRRPGLPPRILAHDTVPPGSVLTVRV